MNIVVRLLAVTALLAGVSGAFFPAIDTLGFSISACLLFLLSVWHLRRFPIWYLFIALAGAAVYHAGSLLYLLETFDMRTMLLVMQIGVATIGIVGVMAILDEDMPDVFKILLPIFCLSVGLEMFSLIPSYRMGLQIMALLVGIYFSVNAYFRVKYPLHFALVLLYGIPISCRLVYAAIGS